MGHRMGMIFSKKMLEDCVNLTVLPNFYFSIVEFGIRDAFSRALHSFEKAHEMFSEQKYFYGFFMGFSCLQNDLCQNC